MNFEIFIRIYKVYFIIGSFGNNTFTIKIGRKTFGSEVAAEKGIEIASRALNHSDTQVTREHYIVPEDSDLDFEFEDKKTNVENIDRHRFDKIRKLK